MAIITLVTLLETNIDSENDQFLVEPNLPPYLGLWRAVSASKSSDVVPSALPRTAPMPQPKAADVGNPSVAVLDGNSRQNMVIDQLIWGVFYLPSGKLT